MDLQVIQWMDKRPSYNLKICKKINSQSFEYYFKTGCKDMYELMCAVNAYEKENVPMT